MMNINLLDEKETAEQLKISIHTLRAWRYQRRLPVVRLGRRVLYRVEDIQRFVDRNLQDAADSGSS